MDRGDERGAGRALLSQFFSLRCEQSGNDPSAGSPTETLLRLHLPLNHEVWITSFIKNAVKRKLRNPESSPNDSIGRCDGRCVQRAGT